MSAEVTANLNRYLHIIASMTNMADKAALTLSKNGYGECIGDTTKGPRWVLGVLKV